MPIKWRDSYFDVTPKPGWTGSVTVEFKGPVSKRVELKEFFETVLQLPIHHLSSCAPSQTVPNTIILLIPEATAYTMPLRSDRLTYAIKPYYSNEPCPSDITRYSDFSHDTPPAPTIDLKTEQVEHIFKVNPTDTCRILIVLKDPSGGGGRKVATRRGNEGEEREGPPATPARKGGARKRVAAASRKGKTNRK